MERMENETNFLETNENEIEHALLVLIKLEGSAQP